MKKSQLIKLVNELLIEDFLGEEYVKGRPPQDWEERDWELFDEGLSSNEKEVVDDILSDLSEGVVNTVLNKMLNYAKKGVLTLAIVSSVVQGLQAQDIPQNDIDQIQQKGTELVQQVVRTDKHTEKTFKNHLNDQDIKKIQDYAEENDWLYTALKGGTNTNILKNMVINKLKKYVAKSQPYRKDIKYYDAVDGGKVVVYYFTYTPASSSNENYADGKVKGKSRPGRVKRSGASCKGSVSSLRAKAKKYGGEKGKMYHWCANMKGGKKK